MAEIPRGRFVWFELQTTDPAAAQQFYPRVIGWQVDTSYPGYAMWKVGARPIGGCMELPEQARQHGAPPHWLGYISTPDVDATVAQAQGRGAQLLFGPRDEPDIGRWAVLSDPQGAVFAAFKPLGAGMTGAPDPPADGDFSWHELATTDHEAALAFYTELFGWDLMQTYDMGPMGTYLIYGTGGRQLGGMFRKPAEQPGPAYWLYYAHVPSADEAAARVTDAGGTIVLPPMEVPGGDRVAVAQDAQGAHFAVHSTGKGS